jgi:DNA invertase Pin-like site-specific DNA recombinase
MATSGKVPAASIRAVSYRRVSSSDQLGGTSPETQLARAEALIRQHGWEHVGDFFDGGVSGAKASRPDLDRLFEMCRAGLVDVVVVGDLSRLSRDLHNSLNFEHELHQLGVEVIDADNPNADELARMFSYLQNHWMRDQIRKNTQRGILAVAEAGYWPVGTAPFAWQIVPALDNPKRKIVVLNEAEAATIRKAIELVVDEGLSCWKAAARLNALGYLPRHSDRWNNVSLRWILKSTHLAGEWVLRTAGREIPIRGPEIITPARMAQLRKALVASAKVRGGNRVYPLSGRIFAACRVPFNGVYRNDFGHWNQRQYECRYNDTKFNGTGKRCYCQRIDADWLEETVWSEVSKVLSDPDRLLKLAREYLDMRGGELRAEATQIGNLDRRLAEAKRKRTDLALAAVASGPEAVADALAEINRDIEALEQMQEQARAWARANAERTALVRNLWKFAKVARERLDNPTPERMRDVFDALDVRVQVVREGARHGRRRNPPDVRITGVLPIGNLHEVASCRSRGGSARRARRNGAPARP